MHEIAMSLSIFPPACMSVCFPSSFPISQLIAVVVVVNRDGMASKAAAVSGDLSSLSLLVYSRLQWRSHYHAHDDDESVSEWAPPPLSFLVFDKLRREQRVSQLGEAFLERGGPWVWGTVHLGAGCTLTRRCIDAGDGRITWQRIFLLQYLFPVAEYVLR